MTHNDRRLARFIRLQDRSWCPGYQYSEYAIFQMWSRTSRWAYLDFNITARDFGRCLIKEFLK